MEFLKKILYWLTVFGPLTDIIKGAIQGIIEVSVSDELARQKSKFSDDNITLSEPIYVALKTSKEKK